MAIAWLREVEELDDEGNVVCTGHFECEVGGDVVDGLPFAEAVAWARERTDRAWADVEWERYEVLGSIPEVSPLPPELAERLARGRRRPVADAWRDRPEDSPPTRWEIVVHLSPPDLSADERPEHERVVERVAARLAGDRCEEVEWTCDELDAGLADIDAQWRRAGEPREFGWMTTHLLAFVLTAFAEAATYRPVLARVRTVVLDELEAASGRPPYEKGAVDIEGRWGVDVDVHPPGYEWAPPLL